MLKRTGRVALTFGLAGHGLSGCLTAGSVKRNLEETAVNGDDIRLARDWDPIYGPSLRWSAKYGGPSNFDGHIRGGATPGIDYDVPIGTPVVPMKASYLRQATTDRHGSLYILLMDQNHPSYRICFGHLDRVLIDRRFLLTGKVMKSPGGRPLRRKEIVAHSGNSGMGLIGNRFVQPPHLHVTLYFLNFKNRTMAYLDPEKFGLDGGRPVFWDGETDLDVGVEKRMAMLELVLINLEREIGSWEKTPEGEELAGKLLEHSRLMGRRQGRGILDSKHFHDLRAVLKKVTLKEKRFLPGTRPYSLMFKVVGYSTDVTQEVILTLPFISTGLRSVYKRPIFEERVLL